MSQTKRLRAIKVAIERLFILSCVFAVGGYFAYHAANGDHGFFAHIKYKAEEERLVADLEELRITRTALEAKVALLRPESLDPDMLDEQSRQIVNMAHPRDIVIPLSSN